MAEDLETRAVLDRLAANPPQTLLLEGAGIGKRLETALYWARALNCPQGQPPCGQCAVCRQIEGMEHFDVFVYDGRISNKADEENPGRIRALNMENIQNLKSVLGTSPRGGGKRVAIFQGMTQTREEAMNSLLKTLEEPADGNCFVLLTPQRDQILPTLVSRAFCLTLPWTSGEETSQDAANLERELADFLQNGSCFLSRIGNKGGLDAAQAEGLILSCQKALAAAVKRQLVESPLFPAFAKISANPELVFKIGRWLGEAQEMLAAQVSPPRIWEALASRMFAALRQFTG